MGVNELNKPEDQPSTICPRCGRKSFHPEDIKQKYCDNCKIFYGFQASIKGFNKGESWLEDNKKLQNTMSKLARNLGVAAKDAIDVLAKAIVPDSKHIKKLKRLERAKNKAHKFVRGLLK